MHRTLRKARLQRIKGFQQISDLIYVITKSNNKEVKMSCCVLRINARHFKENKPCLIMIYPAFPNLLTSKAQPTNM